MEATAPRAETAVAVVTLALAGCAALVLGVADAIGVVSDSDEALFIAAQILGWTLLAWATLFGGLGAIQLGRRLGSRQVPALADILLDAAGAAVIVAVIWAHPLWGSGSGFA